MLTWTSALLLAAPLFLLAYALTHRNEAHAEVPWKRIALVYVVCALAPIVFALIWRIDATRFVLELHAIAFRGDEIVRKEIRERKAGNGRVVIGDGFATSPSTRRYGRLVFKAGNPKGLLTVELPRPEERAGLIATTSEGFLGAHRLQDGDRVCVGGSCWTFSGRTFTIGKRATPVPRRVAELPGTELAMPLPFAKPITAGLRTWSLDWLAHDAGVIGADRRVRSFFCHTRGVSELQLVILDADVSLIRGGAPVIAKTKFDVADEERIAFHSLPPEGEEFAARGVQERRSVVYRAGARSFVLDLDTPEVHSLTMKQLNALRDEKETKKKVIPLAMGEAQLVDRSLYFAGLSESVAVESSALVELSRYFPRDVASAFRIISPRGPLNATMGTMQWVGTNDTAAIRFDVRRPPLLLLTIGLLLLALKIFAAASARLTLTQLLMAGALEALVGIRLLFGHRAWAMPPHKLEAIELAIVAWLALPWIYLVASMPVKSRREALPAVGGLLVSMVLIARLVEGPEKWVWVGCHLLGLAVAAFRLDAVRAKATALQTRWRSRLPRVVWASSPPPSPEDEGGASSPHHTGVLRVDPIVAAAIAFTVVRFLLLLFGFKESANIGARISLSVLHIPAALLLEGFFFVRLWRRIRANGDLGKDDLIAAGAILLFVWLIPAAVTSDIGLALLNIPVFAILLLASTRQAKRGRVIARALAAAILIVLAGAPLFRLVLPFVSSEEVLLSAAADQNYARFFHFAAPERLQELATKRGESLAITSALLQAYISSGIFGRGYGHTEVSPHLGDTALRDFAPAVFIAAEWGLVGTVAALLLYLAFAVIARPWLEAHELAPVVAFLAAATIAVSSIYMILANHELLLLTGKNAYLFGLDSAGDVIEVIVLVLMIAYGATVAPARRVRAFGGQRSGGQL
ncbi:MAG TPA: FtsW/RodA/SpoVE family cell cycle protein [Thermoanaerobaculia bacterium]